MRKYIDKQDAQKKSYFKDRFYVAKESLKEAVEGSRFEDDLNFFAEIEIVNSYIEYGQLVVYIKNENNVDALRLLKERGYEILSELSAVDFISSKGGFEVFYQLLNMSEHKRLRLKCFVEQHECLKSVCSLYKSANWAERELYDMMGILIVGHPNLKRILMPDDWVGHPLLKSYPLHGDEHSKWYEIDKIFGKEYRDIIGEEERDSARISENDTENFVRIYHEVPKGAEILNNPIKQEYQEDGGVIFISKAKRDKSKILKKRP